jgi:hypothetical protein
MAYIHGDVQNWPPAVQQYVSLDQRYAAVLSAGHAGKIATLADVTNGVWAYTATIPVGSLANGYASGIASLANQFSTNPQPTPGGTMRLIISAGHEHIGAITSDPNGVINAAALRGGTGANGEMAWNAACADALTGLLRASGVDAVRTDAIYHADVYGPDADLAYVIHYDGGAGTGHPQYCMASTVHSGPSTTAVDALADAFVADWYAMYPAAMGIAGNGPITTDMLQLYNGWYRTAGTPMVIGEHCLGADAGGIRGDRPTPQAAADAVFAVIAKRFGLNAPNPAPGPPDQRLFPETGHSISGSFKGYWEQYRDDAESLNRFGYPISGPEPGKCRDGQMRTVQWFQRARFEDWGGGDVRLSLLGSDMLLAQGRHGAGID